MDFLNSLDTAERLAFISVAQERTFLRGARLMEEGAPANYVIVILSGWTQITLQENGRARVIAERGPGQLVGERGALRVNVRSATVTALGTVRALVMSTENFASFVDAHPRVLDIIEGQIYSRLTEELAGRPRDGFPVGLSLEPVRPAWLTAPQRLRTLVMWSACLGLLVLGGLLYTTNVYKRRSDLALRDEAPRADDLVRLLDHGTDAPKDEHRVIGKRRQRVMHARLPAERRRTARHQ